MDSTLRFLAPRDHDRIIDLFTKTGVSFPNVATQLQVIKIIKMKERYMELLDKLEKHALKNSGFNFIVRNIPEVGISRDTSQETKIGYPEMRDTLKQFGTVYGIEIIRGTVYVKFDDPTRCHQMINAMQMGKNILSTSIVS